MRTQVFSPTYPTWALVGGTSRPAGETVQYNIKISTLSTISILYLHSVNRDSVSVEVKVIANSLFVEFLKRQTNGPMVVYSHQLIVTKKWYLFIFICSLLQVCKFRVGSFNYPMNKMVFYNELIPEDTIIKSILDYK